MAEVNYVEGIEAPVIGTQDIDRPAPGASGGSPGGHD